MLLNSFVLPKAITGKTTPTKTKSAPRRTRCEECAVAQEFDIDFTEKSASPVTLLEERATNASRISRIAYQKERVTRNPSERASHENLRYTYDAYKKLLKTCRAKGKIFGFFDFQ